jgi:hypothetical protein
MFRESVFNVDRRSSVIGTVDALQDVNAGHTWNLSEHTDFRILTDKRCDMKRGYLQMVIEDIIVKQVKMTKVVILTFRRTMQ